MEISPLLNKQSFFATSLNRAKNARTLIATQAQSLTIPYANSKFHASALIYPIADLLKPIYGVIRLIQGILALNVAIFTSPIKQAPSVFLGIMLELGKMILDVVNAAIAILSIITRNIATLFNFGYPSNAIKNGAQGLNNLLTVDQNNHEPVDFLTGVITNLGLVAAGVTNTVNSVTDETIHQNTFSLSA
ncbi:MAG: hypothetical protein WC627_01420 [Legionella sp.]|jgi:hypothetical protein